MTGNDPDNLDQAPADEDDPRADDLAADPSAFPPPPIAEQARMVEAVLFAAPAPVTLRDLVDRLPVGCDPAEAMRLLRDQYQNRGVVLERIGDGWAFRTAPDLSFLMQTEVVEQRRLSRAATETLAIIAYHQPVTRAEIEEIRGVAVSRGTLDQLIEMEWVRMGRRRMTPGRPATFVVTEGFLDHFGLETARDLPGLSELRAAGLLDARPPEAGFPGLALPDADDDMDGLDAPPSHDLFDDD